MDDGPIPDPVELEALLQAEFITSLPEERRERSVLLTRRLRQSRFAPAGPAKNVERAFVELASLLA